MNARFVLRRLASLPLILFGVSVLSFLLIRLVPVEPAEVVLRLSNLTATEEAIASVRAELGLDRPLPVQFGVWVAGALQLDFGVSYVSKLPIADEIAAKFPATLQLTLSALALTVMASLPLGVLSAMYPGSWPDRCTQALMLVGTSTPRFWLAFILVYLFSLKLDWLPTQGRGDWTHLVLPAFTLAFTQIAVFTRMLRASMLDQMKEPYVDYARARGLRERDILIRHVLRNALAPVATALAVTTGNMLGGTVIIEQIFSWPGLGRYLIESIVNRDYPVIQCYVLVMGVTFVFMNLFVDLLQRMLDPRMRREEGQR